MGRNNFDGLRLIGALMVLVSHMFALSGAHEPGWSNRSLGHYGVLVFFTISGYLVTQSWERDPDLFRFGMRRSLRIVPAWAVVSVLAPLAIWALGQSGFPDNKFHQINGSLWTIRYEVYCYVILAVLAAAARERLAQVLSSVVLLGLVYYLALQKLQSGEQWDFWIFHFGSFFAAGALLSYMRPKGAAQLAACFAAGVLLILYDYETVGMVLAGCPLIIAVGTASWPVLNRAGQFGDFSYGLYVWAWPVQQIVVAALPSAGIPATLVVSLVVSLAFAALSWHLVERPAMAFKPRGPATASEPGIS